MRQRGEVIFHGSACREPASVATKLHARRVPRGGCSDCALQNRSAHRGFSPRCTSGIEVERHPIMVWARGTLKLSTADITVINLEADPPHFRPHWKRTGLTRSPYSDPAPGGVFFWHSPVIP